jgi:hypothetical protein
MTGRYVNDSAILEDGFGTTLAGDQVARMALEVTTPFTLGVTGKWGSGKTSILRRAFATLGGNPVELAVPLRKEAREDASIEGKWGDWHLRHLQRRPPLSWGVEQEKKRLEATADQSLCVWYSPWQHQAAENPLVPLLLEIRAQFSVSFKRREKTHKLLRQGGLAALTLLERVIDAAVGIVSNPSVKYGEGTIEAVRRAWRDGAPEEPALDDGQRFHLLFEDAVDTLLDGLASGEEQPDRRLVIFIDDLDRCEESVVVQLLESIKLYLGSRRCVFILAMDESAVLSALSRHWSGRSDEANREYLEKLFQAVVPVPVPKQKAVRDFLALQLGEHGFANPGECAELIEALLEPNPRKIKNFVNSVCASWGLFHAGATGTDDERRKFAQRFLLFQYLRVQHKPVWRILERQPQALRLLTRVFLRATDQEIDLKGTNMDLADQRILELLFFRSFSHVLRDDAGLVERHRHIPIAEAVELLQDRIDRKRSDECFIRYYLGLFTLNEGLPDAFLYLPELPNV